MARIAGVDLPKEKRVEIGLTYIFGIGSFIAGQILKKTGVNGDTRVNKLTEEDVAKLRGVIEEDYMVDPMKILTNSPLAQSLLEKKVGDKVEVEVPSGLMRLEVTEIVDHE